MSSLKEIFKSGKDSILEEAKNDFLSELQRLAKDVISEKEEEIESVKRYNKKILSKIASIGCSEDIKSFGEAKENFDPRSIKNLFYNSLEIKTKEKELEVLKEEYDSLFPTQEN